MGLGTREAPGMWFWRKAREEKRPFNPTVVPDTTVTQKDGPHLNVKSLASAT